MPPDLTEPESNGPSLLTYGKGEIGKMVPGGEFFAQQGGKLLINPAIDNDFF